MVKAVIFDMDGILFDTENLAYEGWQYAAKIMGFEFTREINDHFLGLTKQDTCLAFKRLVKGDFDYWEARKIRMDFTEKHIEENGVPIKKGLEDLLEFLEENNIKKAVASSSQISRIDGYITKSNIKKYFEAVVGGDMVTKGKPDPEIFLLALEKLGVKKEEAIVVEDSPLGILASHRAGIRAIMIPDTLAASKEDEKLACKIFEDLTFVKEFVKKENNLV